MANKPQTQHDKVTGWIVAISLLAALVLSALLTALGYPDIGLMEIVLVALLLALMPSYPRRKRKKLGLCVKCGYDLRGSKDVCPECGTEFEKT